MQVIEKAFAAIVLLVCLFFLMRMCVSPGRRARLDEFVRAWHRPWQRKWREAMRSSAESRAESRAERTAREAIERARRTAAGGEWDGNVYKSKSFKPKKRDLH